MSQLIINGGRPLRGTATPVPNKNSILKLIPAALLTDEDVVIHNVPQTSDVKYLLEIITKLGANVQRESDSTLRLNCAQLHDYVIDAELSQKMKASVMLLGPLLQRFGKAHMPVPQGCKLGTRPLDVLIENMVKMGVEYENSEGNYILETKQLTASRVRQRFPSVTGTENLILLAVMTPGTTQIYNAACEPHTQDLCNMLVAMGAQIDGIGSNQLTITGVSQLRGVEWTVISDHLDVAGIIAATVMTEGEVTITNAIIPHMHGMLQVFEKLGVRVELDHEQDTIFVPADQELVIHKTIKGNPLRVHALHRPLLPADFVHSMVVVALKASGQAIFDNLFYEYGFFYVQELAKMKANALLANPVTIITNGPTQFKPANLLCSDIIQASYGLLLACMSAPGTSTLNAISPLFRRFPNFVEEFNKLGADLTLIE